MISSPKQARLGGGLLSEGILHIPIEARVSRLMNDADDPFAFHRGKIRPHQVVMRKIDDVAGGKRARWQHEKKTGSTKDRQFHSTRKSKAAHLWSNEDSFARAFFMRPALGAGFVPPRQQ